MIYDCNPMTYILTCQFLGIKYLNWIFILQEFDVEFAAAKLKKSLVISELICDLPTTVDPTPFKFSIPDESLFLISTLDPWYGDLIIYLQTQTF